jgi:hypothetical protein
VSCGYRTSTPTRQIETERATGIEPAFSAWEAHRGNFRELLKRKKSQLNDVSHLTAGIRY